MTLASGRLCGFKALCHAASVGLLLSSLQAKALEEGQSAPDFNLSALNAGSEPAAVSLGAFTGKVVYVDFWASWCAPCLVSMPLLNELRNRYVANGASFEVIAINVDQDPEDGREFLLDTPVDYVVASDPEGKTPAAYQVRGMPTAFLISPLGEIQMIHEGFKRSDIEMIETRIDALLASQQNTLP